MAILHHDGFDFYTTDFIEENYDASAPAATFPGESGTVRIVPTGGRCDTQYIECISTPAAGGITKGVPMSGRTVIFGVAVRFKQGGFSTFSLATVYRGGIPILRIDKNVDGSFTGIINPDSAFPGIAWVSDGGLISNEVWTHVGFKTYLDASGAGTVRIDINGIPAWSVSGINTISSFDVGTGNMWWNGIRFAQNNFSNTIHLDDIYIANADGGLWNDLIGDVHMEYLRPIADGDINQWDVNGAAERWDAVDDNNVPNTATTVSTDVADEIETYEYQDLANVAGTQVYSVRIMALAQKDQPGNRGLEYLQRTAGVTYETGVEHGIPLGPDAWQYLHHIMERNPATSAQWALAEVNAAQFGMKLET